MRVMSVCVFSSLMLLGLMNAGASEVVPVNSEIERIAAPLEAVVVNKTAGTVAAAGEKAVSKETMRPQITLLIDTGLGSDVLEAAAADAKAYASFADVEVLVRGLPVIRTPAGARTDFVKTEARLSPFVAAGLGATIDPGRFAHLLTLAESGLEAGGKLDPATVEVFENMTAAPVAPMVVITIGKCVYAVAGTASVTSALDKWQRTLEGAPIADPESAERLAALSEAFEKKRFGRVPHLH